MTHRLWPWVWIISTVRIESSGMTSENIHIHKLMNKHRNRVKDDRVERERNSCIQLHSVAIVSMFECWITIDAYSFCVVRPWHRHVKHEPLPGHVQNGWFAYVLENMPFVFGYFWPPRRNLYIWNCSSRVTKNEHRMRKQHIYFIPILPNPEKLSVATKFCTGKHKCIQMLTMNFRNIHSEKNVQRSKEIVTQTWNALHTSLRCHVHFDTQININT